MDHEVYIVYLMASRNWPLSDSIKGASATILDWISARVSMPPSIGCQCFKKDLEPYFLLALLQPRLLQPSTVSPKDSDLQSDKDKASVRSQDLCAETCSSSKLYDDLERGFNIQ